MEDFIFGTLATDDLRLKEIIKARRGLAHEQRLPRDPKPGDAIPVTIYATAGPDAPVAAMFAHYTIDGTPPDLDKSSTQTIPMRLARTEWDTLLWAYIQIFACELPRQAENTVVRHQISGLTHDEKRLWVGNEHNERQTFSYVVDNRRVPDWVQDAVIYHIFMDRFAPPGGQFAVPAALSGFYGGSLRGVLDRLDYLSELGINTLWLLPIYPSPSHHGYDVTDFRAIEPRLGTPADFKALVDELHSRQMRLILDYVPNHTSNEHPHFQSAAGEEASPYREHYTFTRWPDDYRSFFGVKTLPQINNEHPVARRYVIDSARYWLQEYGVDGFRLDYAHGPSHDFWTDYYVAVKTANPESFHFGEIVETPALLRSYEGIMDDALDFLWLQAARKLFAFGSSDVAQFEQFLSCHEDYFNGCNFTLSTFLVLHLINHAALRQV